MYNSHAHVLCSMQSITGQSEGRVEPKESRATYMFNYIEEVQVM